MKTVNNVSLATWLAVLLGVSVLTAPPVLAQDTGTAGAAEDEKAVAGPEDQASQQKFAGEITVTAQKREQQLQEVPLSLQVFDGAAMEEVNVRDLSDVFTFIPGASEGLSYSAGQRAFQIRGIAQGAGDPTVGYYMDDSAFFVLAELFAPMGRTFDVQRVEVLRGPQGTLYGNSSMGGTVILT